MLSSVFYSDPQRYLVSHEQDSKLGVIELEFFSLNINTCEKFASWETEPEEFALAPPLKAACNRLRIFISLPDKAGCTQSEGKGETGAAVLLPLLSPGNTEPPLPA